MGRQGLVDTIVSRVGLGAIRRGHDETRCLERSECSPEGISYGGTGRDDGVIADSMPGCTKAE